MARVFWLAVLGGSSWCIYEQRRLGEWPWGGPARLGGLQLLGRSEWGAVRPDVAPGSMGRPRRITIHHLGGSVVIDLDREAVGRSIKAIQTDHIRRRGWSDIGYHFVVDRSGRLWEGRPITQIGAHAGSRAANERNVGIVLLGNFDLQTPSPAQLAGAERLLDALRARYQIDRAQVFPHKDVRDAPTNCPGKNLQGWVESYRKGDVAAQPFSGGSRVPLVRS